jgi:hypothetical protein
MTSRVAAALLLRFWSGQGVGGDRENRCYRGRRDYGCCGRWPCCHDHSKTAGRQPAAGFDRRRRRIGMTTNNAPARSLSQVPARSRTMAAMPAPRSGDQGRGQGQGTHDVAGRDIVWSSVCTVVEWRRFSRASSPSGPPRRAIEHLGAHDRTVLWWYPHTEDEDGSAPAEPSRTIRSGCERSTKA